MKHKTRHSYQQKIDLALQWKRSGQSIRAWSEKNKINESTLMGWISQIRRNVPQIFDEDYQGEWISIDEKTEEGFKNFLIFCPAYPALMSLYPLPALNRQGRHLALRLS